MYVLVPLYSDVSKPRGFLARDLRQEFLAVKLPCAAVTLTDPVDEGCCSGFYHRDAGPASGS